MQQRGVGRVLDVGDQALLAAVQPDEIAGQAVGRLVVAAREVAFRALDLDDARAGIGEAGAAIRRGDRLFERDDEQVGEGMMHKRCSRTIRLIGNVCRPPPVIASGTTTNNLLRAPLEPSSPLVGDCFVLCRDKLRERLPSKVCPEKARPPAIARGTSGNDRSPTSSWNLRAPLVSPCIRRHGRILWRPSLSNSAAARARARRYTTGSGSC